MYEPDDSDMTTGPELSCCRKCVHPKVPGKACLNHGMLELAVFEPVGLSNFITINVHTYENSWTYN